MSHNELIYAVPRLYVELVSEREHCKDTVEMSRGNTVT